MIDAKLMEILTCPKCKGKVELHAEQSALHCAACALGYPIRDGIPVMLIDEAIKLKEGSTETV
ncbi:MAG: Trm112 family protein [Mariprofundaceae bacterium]|nr:Trm112 family protein [Mariprofundaceae bacterium]